jgi:hypothetical protein
MQKTLLQNKTTQKVLSQTKKDTDSLVECRDDSSFLSRWSDNLSKWSTRFDFDDDLQKTMVYIRAFSGRNVQITPKSRGLSYPTLTSDARSKAIDRQLIRPHRASLRIPIIAIMGDWPGCGQLVSEMLKCVADRRSMPDMKRSYIQLVRNAAEQAIRRIPLALNPVGELASSEAVAAHAVMQLTRASTTDSGVEGSAVAAQISKETFQ